MIKAFTFFICCSIAVFPAMSQPGNGQPVSPGYTGTFYGKIIHADNEKAVEAVTVQVIQSQPDPVTGKKRDIIVATQLSNKKGEFNIDKLPLDGLFKLKVSAVGYKPFVFDVKTSFDITNVKPGDLSTMAHTIIKDLGNFKIFPDPEQLEAITVNSNKPLMQIYLDKKVYNVEKDISATGGTAADVVKNIPGLLADADGNVMIRNAVPQLFIDGRPTTLSLDQVPSDQIASIELMTNPSARYDAGTGGGGILNIVLKKNRRSGYNGNLRAGIDSRLRPGLGGDINIKQNKVNFFAAAQFNYRKNIANSTTDRTDFPPNATAVTSQQKNPVNKGYFGYARLGLDFLMTNRTTLSASGNYMHGNIKVTDLLHTRKDTITGSGTISESAIRNLKADISYNNVGANLGMKHNFAEAGKEWTADINFNRNKNDNISDYKSRFYDGNGNQKPEVGAERATGNSVTKLYVFQTDFVNPVAKNTKFETGGRISYRTYSSRNDNYRQEPPITIYTLLPATVVEYQFDDIVYALYASYSHQAESFSYQFGLRMESSEYDGLLVNKNERFGNKYPISLFPSLSLSKKLNDKESLQFNYSRKISRPVFFQILPFVDFSDSLNLSIGNPNLTPEFTHLSEISYSNNYTTHHSFFATLYGRYSSNLITRYQYKGINTDPAKTDSVIYNSFANAEKSYTVGLELTGKNRITKWWDITSNINLFNVNLYAENIAGTSNNELFSWFGKMINSFKIHNGFSLQLSADYQAKTILPASSGRSSIDGFGGGIYGFTQNLAQGYIKPIYGVDIALRKEFLKNNTASLTLQVNDIFRSRTYETHAATSFFIQDNYRLRDPQVFRLNFNWRFGKFDAALFKRKNTKNDLDNLQLQQGAGQ